MESTTVFRVSVASQLDDTFNANAAVVCEKAEPVSHGASKCAGRADAAVQCGFDDMLEPIAFSTPLRSLARRLLEQARRTIEDPDCWAAAVEPQELSPQQRLLQAPSELLSVSLQDDQLIDLADCFLGRAIAGLAYRHQATRGKHASWLRVEDAHVTLAAQLANTKPAFAAALRRSAIKFFLHGTEGRDFEASNTLALAVTEPSLWLCRAFRGLDFAKRLVLAGVLPQALLAAVTAQLAARPSTACSCALLLFVTSARPMQPQPVQMQQQPERPMQQQLPRVRPSRDVGTSLRPFNEVDVRFSRISFAPPHLLVEYH